MKTNKKIDRINEVVVNKQGIEMKIVGYRNVHDIDVLVDDNNIEYHTQYRKFKEGRLVNYNTPSFLGKGYRGYGSYRTRNNNIKTDEYIKWNAMLTRCYSEKFSERKNYLECVVCDDWLNFQNFAKWYNEHKYNLPGNERLELDKDIKCKNNKIYSPETCLLIPKRLNSIILNRRNDRGNYCLGVTYRENLGKYVASCNTNKSSSHLGVYNTELDAFNEYKKAKEQEILRILDTYKNYLPYLTYYAIKDYKIEITD